MTTLTDLTTKLESALRCLGQQHNYLSLQEKLEQMDRQIEHGPVSKNIFEEYGRLSKCLEQYQAVVTNVQNSLEFAALANDSGEVKDQEDALQETEQQLEAVRTFLLEEKLDGKYDSCNALLTLQSTKNKGDCEQEMFALLLGAYGAFAKRKGLEVQVVDTGEWQPRIEIEGEHAYGLFRSEQGRHRGTRTFRGKDYHIYFTVDVEPIIEESPVNILPDDLRYEFLSSSGPGGQHANKTESGVRITHLPTGIQATVRLRSQYSSRKKAEKIIYSRVTQHLAGERQHSDLTCLPISRSYNFVQGRVKDYRTGQESTDVGSFFKGHIEKFILAFHEVDF